MLVVDWLILVVLDLLKMTWKKSVSLLSSETKRNLAQFSRTISNFVINFFGEKQTIGECYETLQLSNVSHIDLMA